LFQLYQLYIKDIEWELRQEAVFDREQGRD